MKIWVFSIGENTTDICIHLLESYGFDVQLIYNETSSLWDKLKYFYIKALESGDEYVMRIDADIIPNQNVSKLAEEKGNWLCATGFDWYKQDRGAISVHKMHRDVVKECLDNIELAEKETRPETFLWRLPSVNPQTKIIESYGCGIHGYGQQNHRERIKQLKHTRGQKYDWQLVERIEKL